MPGPLRYWEDIELDKVYELGSRVMTEAEIVAFGLEFDPQPIHVDKKAAEASMFGGLIASGWHTGAAMMRLMVDGYLNPETSLGSPGLDEIRWHKPVRAGDTIHVSVRAYEKTPSRSKPHIGVIRNEWTVRDQNGEPVMTVRGMGMFRRRPAA
ncbi:MAG: MaoC family dehydratase [Rhodospirillales bacterium]|nr:MaoC family dehydratase [Rhodospirillales bacterium]QQS14080.1 MAG: MaoC family dehydratase [Rhodospirillales bacterium]